MYKILFIFSGHDASYFLQEAGQLLNAKYPGHFKLDFLDPFEIDENPEEYAKSLQLGEESDFIFLSIHSGLGYFKKFSSFFERFSGRKKIFIWTGIEEEVAAIMDKTGISAADYYNIYKYYAMGGSQNALNMILWLASRFTGLKYPFADPEAPRWEGIYDPQKQITDEESYLKGITQNYRPVIGVLFHANKIQENNLLHINCVIKKIKEQGALPLAVYTAVTKDDWLGKKGIKWALDNYFMRDGRPIVDAVINTTGYSLSVLAKPGDGTKVIEESILEKLGVPVLQAMTTYFTLEQWEKSARGLDMMTLSSSVYHPEFDGQIISVPIAYSDVVKDQVGKKRIFRPIEERVEKVVKLAVNWARLRHIPNDEKKVAIIFHNMPPRTDMIGCAYGLDSPAAVYNIVEALKRIGIKTDYAFADGSEIIQRIINGVTNDTRWLPPEQMLERSVAVIAGADYRKWFAKFGEAVQRKMVADWGEPPGEFMAFGDRLAVPGIINGNIFIGLQPPRAFEEQAEACYHSTDLVCPHHYLAYYKWIKYVFKADVIIHIGTHGTLEWLPGKEIGLSKDCYPDLAIDDIPHLYPYIINVPGEGIQAKRRSYAVILDHLMPSMVESDTYDELAAIDDLIKEYYHSQKANPGKLPHLRTKIWKLAAKMNLHLDLQLSEQEACADFQKFIEELHNWVSKIKSSLIKDGLHVYGEVPAGTRLKNMLRALVRLRNGEVPSLPEAVAAAQGYDYERLQNDPTYVWADGRTSLMLLDEINELGRQLMDELDTGGYQEGLICEAIEKVFGADSADTGKLKACLQFICNELLPRLEATTDELKYVVKGVNGEFVTPGPSGCPTRGRARILPTGRNFYSIDPAAVPTRASWEVGKKLGDNLLQRYLQDEGRYPESALVLPHRMRRRPFEESILEFSKVEEIVKEYEERSIA